MITGIALGLSRSSKTQLFKHLSVRKAEWLKSHMALLCHFQLMQLDLYATHSSMAREFLYSMSLYYIYHNSASKTLHNTTLQST